MRSPFPGMDPYLEHPSLWPDVHNRLIAATGDWLGPVLRPRYFVRLEERTYLAEPEGLVLVGRPDLTVESRESPQSSGGTQPSAEAAGLMVEVPVPDRVRETYLEVHSVEAGEVVTVLEVLSPTNKLPGEGRAMYEAKRRAVLGTRTNLVEIDLVRSGAPMVVFGAAPASGYRILVSRGDRRPSARLYPFGVRDGIPAFRLPLKRGDEEPLLELGRLLHDMYERAAYDLGIDYRREPSPPLPEADRSWAQELLRAAGVR